MKENSQLLKSKEMMQIHWGVDLFILFMKCALKRSQFSTSQSKEIQANLTEFFEKTPSFFSSKDYVQKLNQQIDLMNIQMKTNSTISFYTPFPRFSLAVGDYWESSVLNHIDMVERTLIEAAEVNVLDWDIEKSYFSSVLQLFTNVENKKLTPQEGMAKITAELEVLNKKLPKDFLFPIPELSSYDV